MTQTLTTERLREIASSPSFSANPLSHEVKYMARELLANREAQPVSGECNKEVYENGQSACLVDIPKEMAEVICRGISEATGCKVDWHYVGGRVHIKAIAPPAPAVPNEKAITPCFDTLALDTAKMVICDVNRRSDFLGGDIQLLARIQCRVDEACRAAMLAYRLSQGCEWSYDEHDSKWDSSCGDAWMFCDGGPTENGVKFCQNCGKPVLLAAAPEGGNDLDT